MIHLPHRDLIGLFAQHRVAANLLMLLMLLSGAIALDRLNVQFFPTFDLDIVRVQVVWAGASAEDIAEGITQPLEQRLRSLDQLANMNSTSRQGVANLTLEFKEGTDPLLAMDRVRRAVDEFRNLPQDAELPEVMLVTRYEQVARVLLTGLAHPAELRRLARQLESDLLARGIDQIEINGLPAEELSIELDPVQLRHLELDLQHIGQRIADYSRDLPAGVVGHAAAARELRSLDQRREVLEFARIPVRTETAERVLLGTMAQIERRPRDDSLTLTHNDQPAVELVLLRAERGDALKAARIMAQWLEDVRPTLPPQISLQVYDASWELVRDRIMLLIHNGLGGLLLVVAILYLFLTGRVAFWVAWGIPVSFAATLFVLYLAGGSINMMSLFALIMALGIIVDDAIVVGEDALALYQLGEAPLAAAEGGARRMLAPVLASSLTTVAAFLPLMLVGGRIGNILVTIPMVIIAVILASLVESFLVLPGHLRGALVKTNRTKTSTLRTRLDQAFDGLRDRLFRPVATWAIQRRTITVALALGLLIVSFGLIAGGRLNFVFFPTPEPQIVYANASFVAGTPRERVDELLAHLRTTLAETEQAISDTPLVQVALSLHGAQAGPGGGRGDQFGALQIELTPPDTRSIRNIDLIQAWRERIELPAGLDQLIISSRRVGPPGRDLNIRLTGADAATLKAAAIDLAATLGQIPGVLEVEDNMAFGREQLIYSLTPAGEALGLTITDLGRQLRTAFAGHRVQMFQDGADEVEVRVRLAAAERDSLGSLLRLNIRTPAGDSVPLTTVADWSSRQGFEVLRHANGQLAVEVTADVDRDRNNANDILATLETSALPALRETYGIVTSFEGRAADQRETFADLRAGAVIGLALIYIVLAWVFSSYGWPLVVMAIIPFGLTGALFGHWLMGMDLTMLSLFGMFGLSGIVVNDSIILVSFYQQLKNDGWATATALIESACRRLRAVLLTSLTTIAGLLPLLFESSYQAQFLIPMAVSLAFGLAFSTVLVLLVIPALLSLHESGHEALNHWWQRLLKPDS